MDLRLVQSEEDQFLLGPAFELPEIEICAFEFKLKNWRRALMQARRYRAFANRTYVVLPSTVAALAKSEADAFRQFNVGLISHDPDGDSRRLILSRKQPPNSPAHFIQAVGLLMRQDEAGIPVRRPNSANARDQFGKCSLPVNRSKRRPTRSKLA